MPESQSLEKNVLEAADSNGAPATPSTTSASAGRASSATATGLDSAAPCVPAGSALDSRAASESLAATTASATANANANATSAIHNGAAPQHRNVKITRVQFSGRLAFVLAAAASAVGLGNLWRFPYLAAKYGGGAFLLTYLVLVLTFGFTLMIMEVAIGRKTGLSSVGAFRKLGKKYAPIGIIESLAPVIIISFYCVIGGWIMKYLVMYLSGAGGAVSPTFFEQHISQPIEPLIWCAVFVCLSMGTVALGVKRGIERLNRVLMPALIVMSVIIVLYVLTMPGALDGFAYYLVPEWSNFGWGTVVAAMGQMFFSMSLASGVMMTYGSYMRKKDPLEKSIKHIEVFDTGVAFLAGLMIVPAVFAFSGGQADAINAGPGLMFVTLPQVFQAMPGGVAVGAVFFLLVLFAALTSAVSIMEAVVSIIVDLTGWKRSRCIVIVWVGVLALSALPSLGFGVLSGVNLFGMTILDMMDFLASSVLMPLGALLCCLMVGWGLGPQIVSDEVRLSSPFKRERVFVVMVKYIAPVFLVVVMISAILGSLGIVTL